MQLNGKQCSVIIPTLNAREQIEGLLGALKGQTRAPDEIIVVDSQSEDGTADAVRAVGGVRVLSVQRSAFDHGGTRDWALRLSVGDFVVFMTQDALPADERCLENLLAPFEDERIAAAGGRQIARPDARPFERLVRASNYPAESRTWDAGDIGRLGVRAFLISDVFAAYRRSAYVAAGGFDHPILTNEDMLMAQKLLQAGHRIAYRGDAAVYHSHRLTLRQEYRRNYIVGRTMKRYEERFAHVSEMGEGVALARRVMAGLLREGELGECCCFAANCAARLLGNRAGRWTQARQSQDAAREHADG